VIADTVPTTSAIANSCKFMQSLLLRFEKGN
jgi:hypothetical protein